MLCDAKLPLCEGCRQEYTPGRNSKGKFCTISCQQKAQRNAYIRKWAAGEVSGRTLTEVSNFIRSYLFEKQDGQCLHCKLSTWRGRLIPLQLDHEDGNFFNSSPGNLRLLCATCHALTPTYKGRNRGRGRLSRSLAKAHE